MSSLMFTVSESDMVEVEIRGTVMVGKVIGVEWNPQSGTGRSWVAVDIKGKERVFYDVHGKWSIVTWETVSSMAHGGYEKITNVPFKVLNKE